MRWMLVCACVATIGCGGIGGDNEDNNNPMNNPADRLGAVKDDVQSSVVDKLDCSGTISQETRTLVTDALAAADFDPEELVATPEELARFIGAVAVSTDTTAMLVGNVAQIAKVGHLPAAHAGGWDQLMCDDETSAECTDLITAEASGTASSRVECEAGAPNAVRVDFADACTLFVTENDGAVTYRRDDGAYAFDDFALGSVRQLDGVLAVDFESGDTHRMTVGEDEGISVATNAGKSCEERLTVDRLVAESTAALLSIDIDATRLADEKTTSVSTPQGPAVFTRARNCVCPDPGSVMDWRWTGFVKGQGDANLRLRYAEASVEEKCADVSVEILSWPEQCDGESSDCGKQVVEDLLGPLVAATCVSR